MSDVRTAMTDHFDPILRSSNRRDFLRLAALGGMAIFLPASVTACSEDVGTDPLLHAQFSLSTPSGPLNLIYAYTQFMADFYARCTSSVLIPPGRTTYESGLTSAISTQKRAQMGALRKLITKRRISDTLLFDFHNVAFLDQTLVMQTAQTLEDLGVAGINGLVPQLTDPADLLLVAKISSTWARHAAVMRDINYVRGTVSSRTHFAGDDAVDPATGLDRSSEPQAFVDGMQPYFTTSLAIG